MLDFKQLAAASEGLKRGADALEKVAAVAVKIDQVIEAAGGVEGIKEKLAFMDALAAQAPPPEQSA